MKKVTIWILVSIFVLTLTGCSKPKPAQLAVYSFSAESEQFAISNGVMVLGGGKDVFSGGDLKTSDDFFASITSCTTTFYILSGSEKRVILSNRIQNETGDSVHVSDLGQVSGEGILSESDLTNSLWFALTAIDKDGNETVYPLQMEVTEIIHE